jgi:hypothetical protein
MSDSKQLTIASAEADKSEDQPDSGGYFSDLDKVRVAPDYAAELGVKKLLTNVPVRRPHKQWWVRVHPDTGYHFNAGLLEIEGEETYFVDPSLHSELSDDLVFRTLFLTTNRQHVSFLWPVKLPGPDGRIDDWNKTARTGAELATKKWVKVASNRDAGAYDVYEAEAELPEPQWPGESFEQLLEVAFRNRIIAGLDHPVVREIQGRE